MYRDELEQAQKRIDDLEAELSAQEEVIQGWRGRVAGQPSGRPRARVVGVLVLLAVAGAGAWWLARPAPRPPVAAPAPAPAPTPVAAPASSTRARPRRRPLPEPGFHLELPSAERVAELAGRCSRAKPRTIDALPAGTEVIDFTTCAGCDCCQPDGSFPAIATLDEREACSACARDAALDALGFRRQGWAAWSGRPLRLHGAIIELERPARLVAIEVRGITASIDGHSVPEQVALIAYDRSDRAIDASMAPVVAPRRGEGAWPSLRVEACPGEVIARLAIATTRVTTEVSQVAFLAAE